VIKRLFIGEAEGTFNQLFRYTFVGGIAFIADFSSLFILTDIFNIYYLISAAVAFLLGTIINYSLSIIWVFSKRKILNKSFEFAIFSLIGIVGLGLNELIIWVFTEYVNFHYLISKIISAGFVLLWNFFARKFLLFR
jgi:putative flippase GtrA